MLPSPSTLARRRHASWVVVALVVCSFLVGVYVRASRLDSAFALVVVGFLVLNGGLVVLGVWGTNRE